jgi:hypothetical protein
MGKATPVGLFAAVTELVGQGLRLDRALTTSHSALGPDELADAMEQKRRITAALFALLPAALDTASQDREAILDMVSEYDASHLRVASLLEPTNRAVGRHLRRLWRDGQVLETYLPETALKKAA